MANKTPFIPKLPGKNQAITSPPAAKLPGLPSIPRAGGKPVKKGGLFDDDEDESDFLSKKPKK